FDLSAYLERIALSEPLQADAETLHALTQAQTQAIAFENIDVLLGRGISLERMDIFNKLVLRRHGGYCFEQNILLQTVLDHLGFEVMPLGGRVRLGYDSRAEMPARTHLFLKIRGADCDWITDVGFGSYSLTTALRLVPDLIQHTP